MSRFMHMASSRLKIEPRHRGALEKQTVGPPARYISPDATVFDAEVPICHAKSHTPSQILQAVLPPSQRDIPHRMASTGLMRRLVGQNTALYGAVRRCYGAVTALLRRVTSRNSAPFLRSRNPTRTPASSGHVSWTLPDPWKSTFRFGRIHSFRAIGGHVLSPPPPTSPSTIQDRPAGVRGRRRSRPTRTSRCFATIPRNPRTAQHLRPWNAG